MVRVVVTCDEGCGGFARAARAAAEMVMAVMVSEAKAEKANEVAATAMAVRGAAEVFFSRKEADEPMMARTATEVTTAFATVKAVEALVMARAAATVKAVEALVMARAAVTVVVAVEESGGRRRMSCTSEGRTTELVST